jgi:hypothetical protein
MLKGNAGDREMLGTGKESVWVWEGKRNAES